MKTTILLIRHGESVANLEKYFAGQTDVPLTERGLRQAELTAEHLKDRHIDAFYASPLCRAFDTGLAAAKRHGKPVTAVDDLREIDGGLWERLTFEEITRNYPEDAAVWNENIGLCRCTGGENPEEVQERVYACLEALSREHPGRVLCIASHGMAIRAFCGRVLGYDMAQLQHLPFPTNASVTEVEYENGTFRMVKYSEDDHMGQLLTALPKTI